MTNNAVVYLAVLVLAVAASTGCLAALAPASEFPNAIMSSITVDCGPQLKFNECWDFMDSFKWGRVLFSFSGGVTFLAQPEAVLKVSSTSFVLFNAAYTSNWSVEVTYAEAPNKPGFTLKAGYEKTADFERDYVTASIAARHYSLITPTGEVHLPCPGAPPSAQCTMLYLPIVLSYTGSWNATADAAAAAATRTWSSSLN